MSFRRENGIFSFGFLLEKDKQKNENKIEENCKTDQKIVFSGGWEKWILPRIAFFQKIAKRDMCLGENKRAIFINTICFSTIIPLSRFERPRKHYKKGRQAPGKTKTSPFFARRVFLEGVSKKCLLLGSTKVVLCWNTFLNSVISKTQLFGEKGARNINFPKLVDCVWTCNTVFFSFGVLLHVWFGVVGCVVFVCFVVFMFL